MKRLLICGVLLATFGTVLLAQPPAGQAPASQIGMISVSLKNASIHEVLTHISRHADVMIALDVSLPTDGVVTLEVENLSWLEVFERILTINGLRAEQHGPSLWVVRSRAPGEQVLVPRVRA